MGYEKKKKKKNGWKVKGITVVETMGNKKNKEWFARCYDKQQVRICKKKEEKNENKSWKKIERKKI